MMKDKSTSIQGGLTNDELIEAWNSKVMGVKPTHEQLTAFALGIEFGKQDPLQGARGYALLGTGNYCINHSAEFSSKLGAELVITLATDADKSGNRQIGESRDNINDTLPIQADEMVIRIGFLNERGLFALEDQISKLRALHFPDSRAKQEKPSNQSLSEEDIDRIWVDVGLDDCDPSTFARAIEAFLQGNA